MFNRKKIARTVLIVVVAILVVFAGDKLTSIDDGNEMLIMTLEEKPETNLTSDGFILHYNKRNNDINGTLMEDIEKKDEVFDDESNTLSADETKDLEKVAVPVKEENVTYRDYTDVQSIPFTSTNVNDSGVNKGESYVKTNGVNGERIIITRAKIVNGVEVSREVVSNYVKTNPVNKVVAIGTKIKAPSTTYVDETGGSTAMFNSINASRVKNGLPALKRNHNLDLAASVRAEEIMRSFSHTRPDGSPFYTVSDLAHGENVAYGSFDGEVTHGRFMASEGHKQNILNSEFTSVGIASKIGSDGPAYWAVIFGR